MNVHSATDEHAGSYKNDCRETRDHSIREKSAERFANWQTVTVDTAAFAECKHSRHNQNHNQIETVANNNGWRAQRVSVDMEYRREECNRGLLKEFDHKNDCRRENQKSPAVAKTIRTDEQPSCSAHFWSTAAIPQLQ